MGAPTFHPTLGAVQAVMGMELAEGALRVQQWRSRAMAVLHGLAVTGNTFTADDLIARVGLPGSGQNASNAVGAAFSAAAKAGWITKTGRYRPSARVATHGRAVAIWVGHPDWQPPEAP